MHEYVIIPADIPTVPVTDGRSFPVRRIFCIGKNYADHVREMGGSPDDTPPVFFTKPGDAVITPTEDHPDVAYPPRSSNLHYEGELVMALKSGGKNIAEADALSHVYGLALGCDMTCRDLQAAAKDKGGPWDTAKAFDQSAVIGEIVPGLVPTPDMTYTLSLEGVEKQSAKLSDMIFPPARIIAELSTFFELKAGDLIYTGTPEGVGEVKPGQRIDIEASGLPKLSFVMAK